jgi:hypothetical protein
MGKARGSGWQFARVEDRIEYHLEGCLKSGDRRACI